MNYDEISEYPALRGFHTIRRWWFSDVLVEKVYYHVDTGYKAQEALFRNHSKVRYSEWDPEGRVLLQHIWEDDRGRRLPCEIRESPPWAWSVEDQAEPTSGISIPLDIVLTVARVEVLSKGGGRGRGV